MKTYKKVFITTKGHLEWDEDLQQYIAISDEGYWYEGPLALAHDVAALDVDIYRWRDDDGSETAATWLENANTAHSFNVSAGNVQARLRVDISESGGTNAKSQTYTLQYSINGSAFTTLGSATTGCKYFDSSNLTNNTDTTEQLNGGGTFVGTGGQCEDGVVDSFTLSANNDLEAEYTIEFVSAELNDADTVTFQILGSDEGVLTATVTPTSTISKVVARNITASQSETGDATVATLDVINELVSSQTETGDSTTAAIDTLVQIVSTQTESGDTQVANLEVLATPATITTSQAEIGDATTASIETVVQLSSNQNESGDVNTAALQVIVDVASAQIESGDTTTALLNLIGEISANQAESGDTQAASITTGTPDANITSAQTEVGDIAVANLNVIGEISANQAETGDVQSSNVHVLVELLVDQVEIGDTQSASVLADLFRNISSAQQEVGDTTVAFIGTPRTIDGANSKVLTAWSSAQLYCHGSNYFTL